MASEEKERIVKNAGDLPHPRPLSDLTPGPSPGERG